MPNDNGIVSCGNRTSDCCQTRIDITAEHGRYGGVLFVCESRPLIEWSKDMRRVSDIDVTSRESVHILFLCRRV